MGRRDRGRRWFSLSGDERSTEPCTDTRLIDGDISPEAWEAARATELSLIEPLERRAVSVFLRAAR